MKLIFSGYLHECPHCKQTFIPTDLSACKSEVENVGDKLESKCFNGWGSKEAQEAAESAIEIGGRHD